MCTVEVEMVEMGAADVEGAADLMGVKLPEVGGGRGWLGEGEGEGGVVGQI